MSKKKESLYVGQKVWLETSSRYGYDVRGVDKPCEMIVLEANKTSAYISHADDAQSKLRYKVDQRTHQVKSKVSIDYTYRLWLSKEEYQKQVEHEKEVKQLLLKAHQKVNLMSIDDLRDFVAL